MQVNYNSAEVSSDLVRLTKEDPLTQQTVKKVIKVLRNKHLTYLEAKRVLIYTDKMILDSFLNEKQV
ncbi:hypothetical protein [Lactobacillus crispatus]|jgi:hypothetical protein|uniref:hypothetical protein n=1 Tax=Lactobacillus crispatus TaxID=47770 RepID=UPI000F851411|nr:hypothetical protein [Lactobacillus crispatus]DAJ40176.1 MAG TPA: hypothetical protein [Caudoviricetes sp.]AZR15421.1 hypothetical protein C3K22_05280 [Lactobacillus crispatus]MBI1719159.1 hypothetical protein [Lactobacillus crispatus]MCT7687827.1 hypothetical protein [Lactobacillus crispatus]MCT7799696.1 hypothetical protein [Lactobacillus crispatus]